MKTRFAMVGYARNVEKKYFDRSLSGGSVEKAGGTTETTLNCVNYSSNTWANYDFSEGKPVTAGITSNDLLKYIPTGADATSRIGNKIHVKWVKGNITFVAAAATTADTAAMDMDGEEAVDATMGASRTQYMRTTIKYAIVRDLMVNNSNLNVTWSDVFASGNPLSGTAYSVAGVHAELNINNMGRFRVLETKMFTLDGKSPQKTCEFLVKGVGDVRFNAASGPAGTGQLATTALTDTGIYIVWSAMVLGNQNAGVTGIANPVVNSRVCFTDA